VEFNFVLLSMSIIFLYNSSLFVIFFIVPLLIIFKVKLNLLTTCSNAFLSRCIFLIPRKNIGGSAGSFLSCLVLSSVSACRRVSNLLVIVI
jgi:hypothetical protein